MMFTPHGYCLNWNPIFIWCDIATNAIIALAYYAIPITLIALLGKQYNTLLRWFGVAFAVFIFACGTTHVMDIVVLYKSFYWLQVAVQALTAAASIYAAVVLIATAPVISAALRDPGARQRLRDLQKQLNVILTEVRQRPQEQETK